jgi:hypothetical protein
MADQATIDYYIKWKHERNRAQSLGKTHYADNCQIELTRLEGLYPELVGRNCTCHTYSACTG